MQKQTNKEAPEFIEVTGTHEVLCYQMVAISGHTRWLWGRGDGGSINQFRPKFHEIAENLAAGGFIERDPPSMAVVLNTIEGIFRFITAGLWHTEAEGSFPLPSYGQVVFSEGRMKAIVFPIGVRKDMRIKFAQRALVELNSLGLGLYTGVLRGEVLHLQGLGNYRVHREFKRSVNLELTENTLVRIVRPISLEQLTGDLSAFVEEFLFEGGQKLKVKPKHYSYREYELTYQREKLRIPCDAFPLSTETLRYKGKAERFVAEEFLRDACGCPVCDRFFAEHPEVERPVFGAFVAEIMPFAMLPAGGDAERVLAEYFANSLLNPPS